MTAPAIIITFCLGPWESFFFIVFSAVFSIIFKLDNCEQKFRYNWTTHLFWTYCTNCVLNCLPLQNTKNRFASHILSFITQRMAWCGFRRERRNGAAPINHLSVDTPCRRHNMTSLQQPRTILVGHHSAGRQASGTSIKLSPRDCISLRCRGRPCSPSNKALPCRVLFWLSVHSYDSKLSPNVLLIKKGVKQTSLLWLMGCGERGIRTPGPVKVNGFQDRRDRPLRHLSGGKSTTFSAPDNPIQKNFLHPFI